MRTLISEGVETAIPPPPPLPPPPAAAAAVTPPPKFINPTPEQRPEIVPPPEQKAVIDKLVEMVIKHGEEFAMTGALDTFATTFFSHVPLTINS